MNEQRLQDAFAPVPQIVREYTDEALAEVHAMNQRRRKPVLTLALVVAVALTLALAGGAVAAGFQWNTLDFLSRGYRTGAVLPGARDAVQTTVRQVGGVTDVATFTVQEVLCDGRNAYVVFNVAPANPDTLLVTGQHWASSPGSRFDPALPEGKTMAEWAQENGYARILAVRVGHDDSAPDGFDWQQTTARRQSDGSISIMLQGAYQATTPGDVSFDCQLATRWSAEDEPARRVTELTATLEPGTEPLWRVEWTGETAIPDTSIIVEKVVLTGTVTATYSEIIICTDGTLNEQLDLVDENGSILKWSAGVGIDWESSKAQSAGEVEVIDWFHFNAVTAYEAMAEPPKTVRIRATKRPSNEVISIEIPLE